MIVSSDNTATNGVISLLGYDHVNDYCRARGLNQTSLQRKMLDFEAIAQAETIIPPPPICTGCFPGCTTAKS